MEASRPTGWHRNKGACKVARERILSIVGQSNKPVPFKELVMLVPVKMWAIRATLISLVLAGTIWAVLVPQDQWFTGKERWRRYGFLLNRQKEDE